MVQNVVEAMWVVVEEEVGVEVAVVVGVVAALMVETKEIELVVVVSLLRIKIAKRSLIIISIKVCALAWLRKVIKQPTKNLNQSIYERVCIPMFAF